jgi:hypothetical protein
MMLLWWIGAAMATQTGILEDAIGTELDRAMTELRLPEQDGPYEAEVTIVEGTSATSRASFGHTTQFVLSPMRKARVEIRVGNLAVDSTNFSGLYGVADGIEQRILPTDSVTVALRRELWLAMDQAYKGASQQLAGKIAAREGQERSYTADSTPHLPLQLAPVPPRPIDGDAVRETIAALSAPLAQYPEIEHGLALGKDWQGRRLLMNSGGSKAWTRTGYTIYRVEAKVRAASGAVIRNTRSWVARTPDQLPSRPEMVAQADAMARWLIALQDAPVEEDYLGPVLFEAQAATEVFRQLLHPQICGTPPMEDAPDSEGDDGISPPVARLGRRLLPADWTVVDDPAGSPDQAGSYIYDMEGTPAQRVTLIEGGVVRNLLMSRIPRRRISGSTGHARASGTSRRSAMPGVVRVTPPRTISDKALRKKALALAKEAGLPYVMVVRRMTTLAMDDSSQISFAGSAPLPGLSPPVEIYRLYPDGKEEPVRSVSFSGVDRRVLRDIVAAGEGAGPVDMMDRPGASFRSGVGRLGGLPVTWDAPQILISELELRGKPGGEHRVIPPPEL